MRIIAGTARGRKLIAPPGMDTRPTADRIRESLFQILRDFTDGAIVLDLFAGSGALALEALSRGASFAVLNDQNEKAIYAIRRNIESLRVEDRAKVLSKDYRKALDVLDMKFSLVFLDPPYRLTDCYGQVVMRLRDRALLTQGALIVMERDKSVTIGIPQGFTLMDERFYGDTAVSIITKEDEG